MLNTATSSITLPKTRLFGTDGIRGKVGEKEVLNTALAARVGFWTGQILQTLDNQSAPVILGQDSRNSSNALAMAISEGLAAAGVEVWNLGLCPTPAVAHLTSVTKAMGGVMISASHNAPEDNGIKIFGANGTKLSNLVQAQIEAGIRGKLADHEIKLYASDSWGQQYYRADLLSQYVESMQKPFNGQNSLAGLKIVLDLAWGAAVNIAPDVFTSMGAEVIALHDLPNGDRINVNCGSTHLAVLQQAVVEHQADMGFAFDGDADRLMAVDSQGKEVNGDYLLYLWGQALRNSGQLPDNTIVTTVMANLGFENAWTKSGGTFIRTAVGDRHVYAKMAEIGATLGGEQSGHILSPRYSVSGDGVLTALHIAALVKESGMSLDELLAHSFVAYPQILENVRVEDPQRRQNWQECAPLEKAIAEASTAMGDRGRILVRPSGTEPLIRVMVEAVDLDLARYWTDKLVACVKQHLAV
ncbi:phosphoglucosamine mutase [Waterburya agarophytonicola]|nr:phosphoglucosamine mutase [Waterburya agarophytonicola]